MYSTLEGAKKCAKQLKRILGDSGLIYPLAKCQAAVAKAGGYHDWHHLIAQIDKQNDSRRPYDYWGKLMGSLPEACHFPIRSSLMEEHNSASPTEVHEEMRVRNIIPYSCSLEVVHRSCTPLLRPGSGKGQKLRLGIVSGLLLNMDGCQQFESKLDPETLTIAIHGKPGSLLPSLAEHPRFDREIDTLTTAGILGVEHGMTYVFAPERAELRAEIGRRAKSWNCQKEPKVECVTMGGKLAAALKLQMGLDRADAGPKASYNRLQYRGVTIESRFSVVREFEEIKAVVNAMTDDVRSRIASIWCDSRACAVYSVEVTLGMNCAGLPEQVRNSFRTGVNGFNGLTVNHGKTSTFFDPEWPGDDEWFDQHFEMQPRID